jgi:hypothetical protein
MTARQIEVLFDMVKENNERLRKLEVKWSLRWGALIGLGAGLGLLNIATLVKGIL